MKFFTAFHAFIFLVSILFFELHQASAGLKQPVYTPISQSEFECEDFSTHLPIEFSLKVVKISDAQDPLNFSIIKKLSLKMPISNDIYVGNFTADPLNCDGENFESCDWQQLNGHASLEGKQVPIQDLDQVTRYNFEIIKKVSGLIGNLTGTDMNQKLIKKIQIACTKK